MGLKEDYKQAWSLIRWENTYSPSWDYWHRHYPRFDERRDTNAEWMTLDYRAIGAAYITCIIEDMRDPLARELGHYAQKQQVKARTKTKTYYMVSPEIYEAAKALIDSKKTQK
jgi:hypothetical protein